MRKVASGAASLVVLGALILGSALPAEATMANCLAAVDGTYLDIVGSPAASSSLVTITKDGLIEATDADQDGDSGNFDPFTDQHGVVTSCKLVGNAYKVKAYTLDFGQPELVGHSDPGVAGGMARVNYDVSITGRALTGTLVLTFGLAPNAGADAAKTGTGTGQIPNIVISGTRLN